MKALTKKIFIVIFLSIALCVTLAISPQKAHASWAFGDYDQDWEDINYIFSNFKYAGQYKGQDVYKSNISPNKNKWSRSWEEHNFANYAIAVCGNSVNLLYTRESGSNWDRDLVMKMNFSLYRITNPSAKYTFQVKKYDDSDNDGREDSTGYLTDVRNPEGGDLVPKEYQNSTLQGIEYLYPYFFLDFDSLEQALNSGDWKIEFDNMQIYDDRDW